MKGGHRHIHPPLLCQLIEILPQLIRLEMRLEWLDEKDHGELGMNDRLFNIDDVQSLLKEQPGDFRNNPNLILSDYRDDIKVLLIREESILQLHRVYLS
jgi:hypothetical protein